jgi:hypothetical protein
MWIMSKVKTLPMARHDNIAQRVQFPSGDASKVSLTFGAPESDPDPVVVVSQYLAMLWKWCTNLAYVGIHARSPDGAKIPVGGVGANEPYVRWDTALHYHDFVEEKATTVLPDGRLPTLSQVKDADEKTRLYWMRLTGPDAPQRVTLNNAIKRSLTECHHMWNWPASVDANQTPASTDRGSPDGKRARTDNASNLPPTTNLPKTGRATKTGKYVCKKWQDARGCNEPCPDRKTHGCDVLVADNVVCGQSHKRAACPGSAASHNFRNDGS